MKFYTGLYHALLGRGLASDVNGAYPRNDGSVGQLPMKEGTPLYNIYNTHGEPNGTCLSCGYWLIRNICQNI